MKNFVHLSSAIFLSIIIGAAFTFPILAIGFIFAWFYIGEFFEEDNKTKND